MDFIMTFLNPIFPKGFGWKKLRVDKLLLHYRVRCTSPILEFATWSQIKFQLKSDLLQSNRSHKTKQSAKISRVIFDEVFEIERENELLIKV